MELLSQSSVICNTGGWVDSAYSSEGFIYGVYVSSTAGQVNVGVMCGLSESPATVSTPSYINLNYGFYFNGDGEVEIYENGAYITNVGAYTTSTTFMTVYDGTTVRYYMDGVQVHSTPRSIGNALYLFITCGTAGAIANNIHFAPVGVAGATGATGFTGDTGYTGPTGPSPAVSDFGIGNVLRVDAVYGNDSTAYIGGTPYLTVDAAVAAATSGKTIWVHPGTYTLSAGITLPAGVCLRGQNVQTTTIQMTDVSANTTLLTMGENTRVEDLTLKLTSSGHYTLKGIIFGGTTSVTAKLRTCVLTVDNSAASSGGSSVVTGVESSGTGTLGAGSFSFNSLKGSTINVYSNGGNKKRGVLVSGSNIMSTRDVNIYVAQPASTASTGSYVGVETADSNNLGSIQLRTTTIGTVTPTAGQSYTASDILQTNPTTIANPTYLASAGIQVGPGTDLVTKTAGSKGFSTYLYPTTLYYGLKGDLKSGSSGGYMWPGTQAVSGAFPDTGTPAAYYRVQQPAIISGLSVGLGGAAGTGHTVTVLVRVTPSGGSIASTSFTVTLGATDLFANFYDASVTVGTGDRIHVQVSYTGNNGNTAHDLTVQLDMF
jgi:hypothetical protein